MKCIVVHRTLKETFISVVENDRLVEVFIEPVDNQSIVGNVYAGVVENVLPGMQAAFVDIGLEKNAYLYIEDIVSKAVLSEVREKDTKLNIQDYIKQGQPLMVQIKKAPVDKKGARVTLDITLPGRYLVVMPHNEYIGISKRITNPEERERLRRLAEEMLHDGRGIVIRTVAENIEEEKLRKDYDKLNDVWEEIQAGYQKNKGQKSLIRGDVDFATRVFRDVIKQDVDRITVMHKETFHVLKDYIERFIPEARGKIFYMEPGTFHEFDVLEMLRKALKRKAWLDNGGYLIIDKTEALTVIDVNTGKYTGKKDLEETAYNTNLLAAKEVARQIRLRNMGGIIVVDFIDMKKEEHRFNLVKLLEEETAKDSMKVQVMGITKLGLVELTRKKAKRSLSSLLEKTCPICQGKGKVLAEENILRLIAYRAIEVASTLASSTIYIRMSPSVYEYLMHHEPDYFDLLEKQYDKKIVIQKDKTLAYDEFYVDGEK
ncbi:Rne/Rng family ribonuclease [Clostridia bacterium]|nr:Rne/Rng family ribonuclease [Clostridia bacterium]